MSDYAHNIFSYFSINKICCGYSLETPRRDVSNEYSQHIFVGEIKKKIISTFWLIKAPYLGLCSTFNIKIAQLIRALLSCTKSGLNPASILYKSTAGRSRVADGPISGRYRFM